MKSRICQPFVVHALFGYCFVSIAFARGVATVREPVAQEERNLRGGRSWSGGGGGNSGRSHSSGGGSGSHRTNNSNRTRKRSSFSTFGKVLGGLVVGLVGLALLSVFFPVAGAAAAGLCVGCCPCITGICCGLLAGKAAANTAGSSSSASGAEAGEGGGGVSAPMGAGGLMGTTGGAGDWGRGNDNNFEDHVRRAKADVEASSQFSYAGTHGLQPYSGEYTTSYTDLGIVRTAYLNLVFAPVGSGGYSIAGRGRDIDGETIVEDGYIAPNGEAWWRERTVSGPEAESSDGGTGSGGLQMLSRGRFNVAAGTFAGTWYASTMASGAYSDFRASKAAPYGGATHVSPYGAQAQGRATYHPSVPTAFVGNAVQRPSAPVAENAFVMGQSIAEPRLQSAAIPVVAGSVVIPQLYQSYNSDVSMGYSSGAPPVVNAQPYAPPHYH